MAEQSDRRGPETQPESGYTSASQPIEPAASAKGVHLISRVTVFGVASLSLAALLAFALANDRAGVRVAAKVHANTAAPLPGDPVDFNFDVKPILSRRCFPCHGFDPSTRKAKLRLDTYEGATADRRGGAAIVPGQPEQSQLVARISSTDVDERMPPAGHVALEPNEVDTLRRWIEQGAEYAPHWSWTPLNPGAVPPVVDVSWPLDDIDRYIAAKREAAGLRTPADDADRATWLRRVTFDLIGLPPSVAEHDAFVADASPDAHKSVVDRLLASPHYGERWGRHWLDLMRYAETYGHEFDYPIPHAFEYRDYVIRAFNADVPYDDFVTEHLAGDLLENPRRHPGEGFNESLIGTGFWFLHQGTHAPTDVRKDEAERMDNQIDVMTKSFVATTVSCARCHDHKFDAIPTTDYYALMGFLQSSRQREVALYPQAAEPLFATLRQLHSSGRDRLASLTAEAVGTQITQELRATHEALFGDGYRRYVPRDPVVFEDFENGSYEGWTVEGTAFGPAPQTLGTVGHWHKVNGHRGRAFVNSHESREQVKKNSRDSDHHVGKLISRDFVIELPRIDFLINGGNHEGKTCVNLVIDGKTVQSVTGANSPVMRPESLDVREFIGKTARFEIVDQHRGGWGHIGVDAIEFRDVRPPLTASRDVEAVAREYDVTPERIQRWISALGRAGRAEHSFHPWHVGVTRPEANAGENLSTELETWLAQQPPIESEKKPDSELFESFDNGLDHWFVTGEAWQNTTVPDDWREQEWRTYLEGAGVAHSGLRSRKLTGSLRSPTFILNSKRIQYRVAGRGRIRLIIEGYTLDRFNALLFNGASIDVNTGGRYIWQEQAQDVEDHIGHRAYIELSDFGDDWLAVDEIRFSDNSLPNAIPTSPLDGLAEVQTVDQLAEAFGRATARAVTQWRDGTLTPESKRLLDDLSNSDLLPVPDGFESIVEERHRVEESIPRPRHVLAIDEGSPEEQPVYVRGNHAQLGEEVNRRFLIALADEQAAITAGSGRLELAERMLDERNPLAARVIVNRVWHHLFGRGIVATPDDFGALGRLPTHPRLLDHLATWFRTEGDWSIKRLIRRLTLTKTYRMASTTVDPNAVNLDPNNDLFHSMRAKRLQGEAIRDAVLAVSGRLDRQQFGPAIPIHLTDFLQGRGRPRSGPLDGKGRRSIYLSVNRNFMSPMMQAFDAPVPMTTIGRRNVSNVPAQALMLMNDPFVQEQAVIWARAVLAETKDPDRPTRITAMFRRALGRPPTAHELSLCEEFWRDQSTLREASDPNDEHVWADLAHVIYNMKDFLFVH